MRTTLLKCPNRYGNVLNNKSAVAQRTAAFGLPPHRWRCCWELAPPGSQLVTPSLAHQLPELWLIRWQRLSPPPRKSILRQATPTARCMLGSRGKDRTSSSNPSFWRLNCVMSKLAEMRFAHFFQNPTLCAYFAHPRFPFAGIIFTFVELHCRTSKT